MTSPSGRTSTSEPSVADRLEAVLEPVLGRVAIEQLQQLSGGASRETWSFTAGGHDLILRRDPPGRPGAPGSMRAEADAMRAVRAGGTRGARRARRRRRQHARNGGLGHATRPRRDARTQDPARRRVRTRAAAARAPTRRVPRGLARNRSRRGTRCARGRLDGAVLAGVHHDRRREPDVREGVPVASRQSSCAHGNGDRPRRPPNGQRDRRRERPRGRDRLGARTRR